MKRRSGLFAFAVVLMATVALVGCSKGPVKLTFTTLGNGDPEAKAFDEIFAGYAKQSGNTVTQQILPDVNEYENIIKTRFATNDAPDIFYFSRFRTSTRRCRPTRTLSTFRRKTS